MVITYSQLSCTANFIPAVHELLAQAKFNLYAASNLGKQYVERRDSIFWIAAKESTRRRVRGELNHFAFDAYTLFLDATEYLNEYAQLMNEIGVNEPSWWPQLYSQLSCIDEWFNKEHDHQIYWRQLQLVC